MVAPEAIIDRISGLVQEGHMLKHGDESKQNGCTDPDHYQRCHGFLTSALHVTELLFPEGDSSYLNHILRIYNTDYEWHVNNAVGEVTAVLSNLRIDLEKGLLSTIINQMSPAM